MKVKLLPLLLAVIICFVAFAPVAMAATDYCQRLGKCTTSLTATNAGKRYIGITLGAAYPMMLPTNMVVFLELGNRHVIMSTTISTTITNVPVDM